MEKEINTKLLRWYKKNKRILPWRVLDLNNLPIPYYIFVSEYMLQQTTVQTVIKKFNEFITIWPKIDNLASSNEEKILNFWSGLGYYSRARNLLKAAKKIKKNFNGTIPNNYKDLIDLPGVGEYTAKAILGIAYNKPVMPLDANIERIIARIYAFQEPKNKIKKKLIDKSNLFISKNSSTNLIQAFMDYGSLVCSPRKPNCNICSFKYYCLSYKKKIQNTIPLKIKPTTLKRKKYSRAYIFCNEKNEILIRKRDSNGMLASMLEVPNDKWVENKKNLVLDNIANNFKKKIKLKGYLNYSFSHFDLYIEVYFTKVKKNLFKNYKWINRKKINNSGLPTVMKKIIEIGN